MISPTDSWRSAEKAAKYMQEEVERWRIALRGLLEKHGSALTILEVTVDRQPARLARFTLEVAATEVRASHDAIRLALGGPAMTDRARREEIYSSDLTPYVDLLAIPEGRESVAGWLQQVDPLAGIVFTPADAAAGDPARVVDGALRDLGTEVVMHA